MDRIGERFDHTWAARLGVQTDELEIVAPYSAELALDIIIAAIKSREYGLIVVDSLAALSPKMNRKRVWMNTKELPELG